jgi:hypothetical protein
MAAVLMTGLQWQVVHTEFHETWSSFTFTCAPERSGDGQTLPGCIDPDMTSRESSRPPGTQIVS